MHLSEHEEYSGAVKVVEYHVYFTSVRKVAAA